MAKELEIFSALMRQLQKLDAEFPIQYAICLIEISKQEGLSMTMLAEKTGLALSTVSKIAGALSNSRQIGTPFQLIDVKVSPQERRRKEIYLSESGRKLINDIISIMQSAA